jgi:hypothetical protein
MGKYTFEGLQTSLEGVPQTQFFLTGKNLPGPSKKPSEQPKEAESVTPEPVVPEQDTPNQSPEPEGDHKG